MTTDSLGRPIVASRQIAAPAEAVLRFLADLENHVQLAPGSVEVLSLDTDPGLGAGALVRLKGPLAIRRTASTEFLRTPVSDSIVGRARIGDGTRASVVWRIQGHAAGSAVTLCATIDAASPRDGLLLRLGGRRWLAKRFAAALDHLADQLATAGSGARVLGLPQPV
jgi:carbon monoxide dehydrogenase subunit G